MGRATAHAEPQGAEPVRGIARGGVAWEPPMYSCSPLGHLRDGMVARRPGQRGRGRE